MSLRFDEPIFKRGLDAKTEPVAEMLAAQTVMRVEGEKMILSYIEALLDPVSLADLKEAAQVLRPNDYEEVMVERNLGRLCGYPICSKEYKVSQRGSVCFRF